MIIRNIILFDSSSNIGASWDIQVAMFAYTGNIGEIVIPVKLNIGVKKVLCD
jgi:hypothetical protein